MHTGLVSQAPLFQTQSNLFMRYFCISQQIYLILYLDVTNNCRSWSKKYLLNLSNEIEFKKNFNFPQKKKKCFYSIPHKHTVSPWGKIVLVYDMYFSPRQRLHIFAHFASVLNVRSPGSTMTKR